MSLVKINWHPNRKELRNFGIISLIATAAISLLLGTLKELGFQWCLVILAIGLFIFLASLLSGKLTRMIYLGLTLATAPIGVAVSFLVLAAFYFLLITPLGLLFRLVGRDLLGRKFDSTEKSYWQPHRPPDKLDRYFRQF